MEVLWKLISEIINFHISYSVQFHDSLHGFCTGRETGTSTLKAKLLQQLIAMRNMVIHSILLDLHKAYDVLDRDSCLDILAGYGVGPRTLHVLWKYWAWL